MSKNKKYINKYCKTMARWPGGQAARRPGGPGQMAGWLDGHVLQCSDPCSELWATHLGLMRSALFYHIAIRWCEFFKQWRVAG